MGNRLHIKDFSVTTYESAGSFGKIRIDAEIMFTDYKQIANIDLASLKDAIVQNLSLQSITLEGVQK